VESLSKLPLLPKRQETLTKKRKTRPSSNLKPEPSKPNQETLKLKLLPSLKLLRLESKLSHKLSSSPRKKRRQLLKKEKKL